MALIQTPANVAIGSGTTPIRVVQFGEAVTQGMPVYKATDSKWYQCDANDGVTKARCGGIALTPAGIDGYGIIAEPGATAGQSLVNLGATLTVGETYSVSATKGSVDAESSVGSSSYATNIGIAQTADLLDFQVTISNTLKA